MKAKVKNTVIGVAFLAIGYIAGAVIGYPALSGDMTNGDISKVSMFRKAIIEPEYSAFEAKLLNDTLACEQESFTKDILVLKLKEFATLVDSSILVAGDIAELQDEVNALRELKEMSENAAKAGQVADEAFQNLQEGNKDNQSISYEQASQNMVIAYMLIDKQVRIGKAFAIAADQYYAKHSDLANLANLATIRDSWALFCSENAMLNGDKEEQKYWSNKNVNYANSKLIKVISAHEGSSLSQTSGESLSKTGGEALSQTSGEKLSQTAGEKLSKTGGEKLSQTAGEKLSKMGGESLSQKIEETIGKTMPDLVQERLTAGGLGNKENGGEIPEGD